MGPPRSCRCEFVRPLVSHNAHMCWHPPHLDLIAQRLVLCEYPAKELPQVLVLQLLPRTRPSILFPPRHPFINTVNTVFAVTEDSHTLVESWSSRRPPQSQDYGSQLRPVRSLSACRAGADVEVRVVREPDPCPSLAPPSLHSGGAIWWGVVACFCLAVACEVLHAGAIAHPPVAYLPDATNAGQ